MTKTARIICCGEALIDMIPVDLTSGGVAYEPCSGGSVFNTAIALGRLGVETEFLTGLSSDMFGEQIKATLADSGVATSLCKQSQLLTTLAFVKLENGHATYTFFDENSAGRMLSLDDVKPIPDQIETMFFGGISLAVEPCAQTYEAILVREAGKRVIMMDPNIRPGFIQDRAVFTDRIVNMMSHSDIVKVSDEDLAWLMGDAGDMAAQVARLKAMGPAIILVTRGGEGATAYLADGREVGVPSETVEVVDTVGAGDTFSAGILARLDELGLLSREKLKTVSDDDMASAMAFAARVAAVTVSRKGANPPWRKEL